MNFAGKVAVVTGAGQGVGARIAEDFAAAGAKVALISRTQAKVEAVAQRIRTAGGSAQAYACDVGDPHQVEAVFSSIATQLGTVDILVNNAVAHILKPISDLSVEEWDVQIRTNLNGTFYCSKAVLPGMQAKKYGKIVNISSSAVKFTFPGFGAYAASKSGVVSLTQTLSEEMKFHNINVNVVNLGMTLTEDVRKRIENNDKVITIPPEDMLQVGEIASIVLFLSSDAGKPIMGAAIDVFGKKP